MYCMHVLLRLGQRGLCSSAESTMPWPCALSRWLSPTFLRTHHPTRDFLPVSCSVINPYLSYFHSILLKTTALIRLRLTPPLYARTASATPPTCSAHAWEATARATPAAVAPGPPPRMVNSPVPLAPAFKTSWHTSTALVQYAHYAAPLRTHRQCRQLSRAQRMHGRLQLVPLRLQPHQGRHHAWSTALYL